MVSPAETLESVASPSRSERRLEVLAELADLGLDLVRSLKRHVLAAEQVLAAVAAEEPTAQLHPAIDAITIALAYSRISRAVRMTLALEARLEAGALRSRCPADAGLAANGAGLRKTVRAVVTRVVDAMTGREAALDVRERESAENLFDPDDFAGCLDGVLSPSVGEICDELGVSLISALPEERPYPPAHAPGSSGSLGGPPDP
jgi:hypothetical protein